MFLERLDKEVHDENVEDSSTYSVPHFPHLRTNRFLTALEDRLENDGQREDWLRWMQKLDLEARRKEIHNLPAKAILALDSAQGERADREALYRRVESCSSALLNHDLTHSELYQSLVAYPEVPDEYSLLMRTVGLYPVASIPVIIVTGKVRKKVESSFNEERESLPTEGDLMSFAPAEKSSLLGGDLKDIIERSRSNPLRVPKLEANESKSLAAHFAPVFIQDVAASHDRFGKVAWKGDRLEVRPETPTVYWYLSHAFFKGMPTLQINYVIWYSERDGRKSPWIERGHLDGLTVRVSLDTEGEPFMVDVMNNCGCYHFFAPQEERVTQVVSKRLGLDPFIPQWLPTVHPGERLGIRVNSGWHQVERLVSARTPVNAVRYDLLPYEVLETLPRQDGASESMFDAQGIAKGSGRIESFILFPMGIPSVGSMRQRGHHAISLTGRVHFDDPFLFDRNFVFK